MKGTRTEATCAQGDCTHAAASRGMCRPHYYHWWRQNREAIKRRSPEQRFWEKVQRASGCWEWQGARSHSGHALIFWNGRSRPASHVALEIAGLPRPEGREACHRCDNPPCVNPAHLYWGTRQDNIDDAYARGGRAGGERHAAARLTEAQVIELRTAFAGGAHRNSIAARFGIKPATVNDIASGRKWKNAPGPITTNKKGTTTND